MSLSSMIELRLWSRQLNERTKNFSHSLIKCVSLLEFDNIQYSRVNLEL